MDESVFWEYFAVLVPSIGLGLIFWLVMRSLFRGDSSERQALSRRRDGESASAREEREAQEWMASRRQARQDADAGDPEDPEDDDAAATARR